MDRDALIAAILEFLAGKDLLPLSDIRLALEREVDAAGPDALLSLKANLAADRGWDYYPRDHLAQRVHHLLADRFLTPDSQVFGIERLAAIGRGPVVIFSNHLSYSDANVIEVLLQQAGAGALANRLTALAGPKVYSSRQRRFSSLCFGTVKVPQSADVSSEEAAAGAREVARAARQSIDVALARLLAGDALVLFGEGTRSRTGAMQPMLAGVSRYLGVAGTWVLPVGLTGPEALFPVGDDTIRPARVTLRIGQPLPADRLLSLAGRDRRVVMDTIGLAIAELLPESYRGVYAAADGFGPAAAVLYDARHPEPPS